MLFTITSRGRGSVMLSFKGLIPLEIGHLALAFYTNESNHPLMEFAHPKGDTPFDSDPVQTCGRCWLMLFTEPEKNNLEKFLSGPSHPPQVLTERQNQCRCRRSS